MYNSFGCAGIKFWSQCQTKLKYWTQKYSDFNDRYNIQHFSCECRLQIFTKRTQCYNATCVHTTTHSRLGWNHVTSCLPFNNVWKIVLEMDRKKQKTSCKILYILRTMDVNYAHRPPSLLTCTFFFNCVMCFLYRIGKNPNKQEYYFDLPKKWNIQANMTRRWSLQAFREKGKLANTFLSSSTMY